MDKLDNNEGPLDVNEDDRVEAVYCDTGAVPTVGVNGPVNAATAAGSTEVTVGDTAADGTDMLVEPGGATGALVCKGVCIAT